MSNFHLIVFFLFVFLLVTQWTVFFFVRHFILDIPGSKVRPRYLAYFVLSVVANLLMAIVSINASWTSPESLLRQSLSVSYFFYLGVCLSLFLYFMALLGLYLIFHLSKMGSDAAISIIRGKSIGLKSKSLSDHSLSQPSSLPGHSDGPGNFAISRRTFMRLTASTGALAIVSYGAYGLMEGFELPRINTVNLSDPSLAKLSRPIRIVQITDLHYGMFYSASSLKRLVDTLNSIEADAVVVTGDLFHSLMTPVKPAGQLLRNLRKRAWGNFAVLGNHDFYAGLHRSVRTIREAGITLLRNEWMTFHEGDTKVHIGGIDDPMVNWLTGREIPSFDKFISQKPQDQGYFVLLSHRPVVFPLAVKAGVNLTLAGHTHGGQITIPAPRSDRPWSLAGLVSPYTLGMYESGQSHMYVNRGIGMTFVPARINCPPEIAVMELSPTKKA